MSDETRRLEHTVEIAAPADAVWRALTDAEELKRWFPLDARVEPGEGGKIWISWGPGSEGETSIRVWEPNRHLQTGDDMGGPVPFAIDYYIEARGGTTVLRLVTSGFGDGAMWDDMYDGMEGGWRYFLFNLRHYLERHAGTPRRVTWERRRAPAPHAEFWRALTGALGLSESPAAGDELVLPLGGRRVAARVGVVRAPTHLGAVIGELDDALVFFELEPGREQYKLGAYLSTYGIDEAEAERVGREFIALLDALIPAS